MKLLLVVALALLLLGGLAFYYYSHALKLRWVVYYTNKLPAETFLPYDVIVFDDLKHPPLGPLQQQGKKLLGYISYGESGSSRPFKVHEVPGLKLKANRFWPGNYVLDVRKPEWQAFLLETHIPSILAQGFDGIMIDTIDSATALENDDLVAYRGMKKAMVALVKATRERFPQMVIMVNRGFDVLPEIAPYVDMLLVESILSDYDWEKKTSFLVAEDAYKKRVKELRALAPKLQIMSLDYWDPADVEGVRKLYKIQRDHGFHPYVSTIDLKAFYPEPNVR